MSSKFEATCGVCGKTPSIQCREHFVARIAELEAKLARLTEIETARRCSRCKELERERDTVDGVCRLCRAQEEIAKLVRALPVLCPHDSLLPPFSMKRSSALGSFVVLEAGGHCVTWASTEREAKRRTDVLNAVAEYLKPDSLKE